MPPIYLGPFLLKDSPMPCKCYKLSTAIMSHTTDFINVSLVKIEQRSNSTQQCYVKICQLGLVEIFHQNWFLVENWIFGSTHFFHKKSVCFLEKIL